MAARATKQDTQVKLRPLVWKRIRVRVEGVNQLVTHAWSNKALRQMRGKKTGEAPRTIRENCDPEQEGEEATYRMSDGRYALPVTMFKKAITNAAHKDIGIPKTAVTGSIFIIAEEGELIPLDTPGGKITEHWVRLSSGAPDLRYRPVFEKWGVDLEIEYDPTVLNPEIIVHLLERAGGKIGIGEGRPQRQTGLDWGRFCVKTTKQVRVKK